MPKKINRQIAAFENRFQIKIEPEETVYSALMFSEGGTADGRTVANRARTFLSDELFELFRSIMEANTEKGIKNLEKVIIKTDLTESSEEIVSLFYPSKKCEILLYASKQTAEVCKALAPDLNLIEAQTIAEAKRKLKTHDISYILIEMEYGVVENHPVLNFEDVKSKARDFWQFAQLQFPKMPVFFFKSDDRRLMAEERISYLRHGVRDILSAGSDFADVIGEITQTIHKQNSMSQLAKSNKLLEFETSQMLNGDGTTATIQLFNFKLSVAIDAEDNSNILCAVGSVC